MKLTIPFFVPKVNSETLQTGNVVFIIFGGLCILIGLIILLMNRKKRRRTQKNVSIGFLIVGILTMINNLFQYFFWN